MTAVSDAMLREYHRRRTHIEARTDCTPLASAQVQGELIGLRGALGIVLGGAVQGGEADRLAVQEYNRWAADREADTAACTCDRCKPGWPEQDHLPGRVVEALKGSAE